VCMRLLIVAADAWDTVDSAVMVTLAADHGPRRTQHNFTTLSVLRLHSTTKLDTWLNHWTHGLDTG
jgi:hypothetical protein